MTPFVFLWGYLKSKDYVNKPDNLDDLKGKIRQMVENVQLKTLYLLQKYLEVTGQYLEHKL